MVTLSLVPQWSYLQDFQQANDKFKKQQKRNYDKRHRVRDLPEIPDDTDVWITTGRNPVAGRTVNMADTPLSYIMQTPSGEIRRNRSQLNIDPSTETIDPSTETETAEDTQEQQTHSPIMTRSRTGTSINPPKRLT